MGLAMNKDTYSNPMARNLFILSALALLAGCASPTLPPSASGVEPTVVTPTGAPSTGKAAEPTAPAAVPAKKKLPLGTVRQK